MSEKPHKTLKGFYDMWKLIYVEKDYVIPKTPHIVLAEKHSANSLELVKWCNNNCKGLVTSKYSLFFFEYKEDATMFNLVWA